MALMFSRVARNFIKNGYFPTDEETLSRLLTCLSPSSDRFMRIFDPCAGEGSALAEVHQHLQAQGGNVDSFGIEYNEERAWHAKQLLNHCIHADLNDCNIGLRSFSLLWLNPPYGDLVSDSERAITSPEGGRKRLEKEFAKRCFPLLQAEGVLVLIVPYTVLDREFAALISRHFDRVTLFAAPEQQFRQAVILGKKRSRASDPDQRVVKRLTQARDNLYLNAEGAWVEGFATACVLPAVWRDAPYAVPPTLGSTDVMFHSVRIDQRQLKEEIQSSSALWHRFDLLFRHQASTRRPPLRKLSPWHLALMLAAGQVSGVVRSRDGQVFVVKGDTYKAKSVRTETEVNENTGDATITRIATDKFVPVIRALDFTPGSATFGRAISIE